jgi:hypothetical protein
MNTDITFLTYLNELAATSLKHGGELVAVSTFIFIAVATAMISGSPLVAIVPIAAALLFESAMTAWRLYHRQMSALATTRQLLDLNASDRAELESDLHSRYLGQQARIEARHAEQLETLSALKGTS